MESLNYKMWALFFIFGLRIMWQKYKGTKAMMQIELGLKLYFKSLDLTKVGCWCIFEMTFVYYSSVFRKLKDFVLPDYRFILRIIKMVKPKIILTSTVWIMCSFPKWFWSSVSVDAFVPIAWPHRLRKWWLISRNHICHQRASEQIESIVMNWTSQAPIS